MDMDSAIFTIIANGGDAKALGYESLQSAYDGKFDLSKEKLAEAEKVLTVAHSTQTNLIQSELNNEGIEISLIELNK